MGRAKIAIKRIDNVANRRTTWRKRSEGLAKKVHELAVLCGAETLIQMQADNGKVTVYDSRFHKDEYNDRYYRNKLSKASSAKKPDTLKAQQLMEPSVSASTMLEVQPTVDEDDKMDGCWNYLPTPPGEIPSNIGEIHSNIDLSNIDQPWNFNLEHKVEPLSYHELQQYELGYQQQQELQQHPEQQPDFYGSGYHLHRPQQYDHQSYQSLYLPAYPAFVEDVHPPDQHQHEDQYSQYDVDNIYAA